VPFRTGARTSFPHLRQRRFSRSWGFLPPPFFYPDYDYDYDYDYEPIETQAPPPREVVVQSPAPAASPAESLVLELHGDQWVRVGRYGQSPTPVQSMPPSAEQAPDLPSAIAGRNEAVQLPPKLPPAVLVFRDGHKEAVERYSIIDGVVYTSADYWSTGSWTRKVPIVELDLPATLKLNRERGVKFPLPSGPNEVVVRP
jgi:hypothetical protein